MKTKVYQIISENDILNGTLIRVPDESAEQTSSEDADDNYDGQGAMHFILATILVYAVIGVFCTLMLRIKRICGKGKESFSQDENVLKYLKQENALKERGHKFIIQKDYYRLVDRVKQFEETQKKARLERELSTGEFSTPVLDRPQGRWGRKKRGDSAIGSTLGKMGMSLFYLGASARDVAEADEEGIQSDDSEADEHLLAETQERAGDNQENEKLPEIVVIADMNSNETNGPQRPSRPRHISSIEESSV